jgi:hypothetical protein
MCVASASRSAVGLVQAILPTVAISAKNGASMSGASVPLGCPTLADLKDKQNHGQMALHLPAFIEDSGWSSSGAS